MEENDLLEDLLEDLEPSVKLDLRKNHPEYCFILNLILLAVEEHKLEVMQTKTELKKAELKVRQNEELKKMAKTKNEESINLSIKSFVKNLL